MKNIKENKYFREIQDVFPRIAMGLEIRWGSKELELYITKLLTDTRDGEREGFPKEIASSLFNLTIDHNNAFPYLSKDDILDKWVVDSR
jgi:hypothetical protein